MGEIADMMIDGTMCPCGEFIDDGRDGPGYPQFCSDECQRDYGGGGEPANEPANEPKDPRTINCPEYPKCFRRFRTRDAAAQHWKDKHG